MDEITSKEPIKAVGWNKKIMIESLVRLLVGVREIIIESLVRLLVGVREIIIKSLVRLLGEAYQGWYDSMLTKAGTHLFCSGPEICRARFTLQGDSKHCGLKQQYLIGHCVHTAPKSLIITLLPH